MSVRNSRYIFATTYKLIKKSMVVCSTSRVETMVSYLRIE